MSVGVQDFLFEKHICQLARCPNMYCTAFMKYLLKIFLLNIIENPVQILCLSGVDRQQGHDRLISVKLAEETHGLVLSALISLIT